MTADPLEFLHAARAEAEKAAEAARDVDYAQCGVWEARGPYPAASGEADGVLRPRGNLRAEIGKDDIFLDAELPWDLIPHMARHDPAAVLRRIAAERKQLELHRPTGADFDGVRQCLACGGYTIHPGLGAVGFRHQWPCPTIRYLAQAWGWTEATDADAPA